MNGSAAVPQFRDRAIGIVATGTILAILYFARDVLLPITLAVILSLLISPVVRVLRRWGLGATSSVLAAALVLTLACGAVAAVIGVQVVRMAQSLPQYERTIQRKFTKLNEMTIDRLAAFTNQTERVLGERGEGGPRAARSRAEREAGAASSAAPSSASSADAGPAPAASAEPEETAAGEAPPAAVISLKPPALEAPGREGPIPVVVHQPPKSPLEVTEKILGSLWVPLETAGIVLVVLIFVLLERESVRDRFIRIAGATDLRATTLVLNDAGERLSRFFVSQFAVNVGVGAALWLGLAVIGLPHATLFAALATVLRFVPYIGIWIAALFSVILATAVDPGWSLAIITLCLFVTVELIAGNLVEPQLYGHTTGLSPLSVVVAAIFWSWLWGPIGLVVSTPLTLCLVVAGRHIKALSLLDILLGDSQALTMPERFYQRALSADPDELIANARGFLKHNSLAAYGDFVLMPALRLAAFDIERGSISSEQQLKVRRAVVAVVEAIGEPRRWLARRREAISVLDQMSAGRQLRRQREELAGAWQGPLAVPPGSVVICVSLGSILDDMAAELLVRILREKTLDGRHLSIDDLHQPPPPGASPVSVSIVYLVSAAPGAERQGAAAAAEQSRRRFSHASLVAFFLPGLGLQPDETDNTLRGADKAASTFGDALQICLDLFQQRTKT
jgi:predicted PurR-regulated permease PerM